MRRENEYEEVDEREKEREGKNEVGSVEYIGRRE